MLLHTLLFTMTALRPVEAQPRTTHVVAGIVYDSVSSAPLPGAIVQAVLVDSSASAPRVFSAITDARGHYRIIDVPSGRFAIGFQHRTLDLFRIEAPIRAFEVRGDSVMIDLAIPAGPVLRPQVCGKDQRLDGEGFIAGYVSGAVGEAAMKGAVIRARWVELALEQKNYRSVTRTVTAVAEDDGRYVVCGVTSDDAVRVDITMPGHRAITTTLAVPRDGATRQDFRLASSGVTTGASAMSGRVAFRDGSLMNAGRATIPALSVETPVRSGDFSFAGLPGGTWLVEVTGVGVDPQTMLVDVTDGAVAAPRFTLDERAQVLSGVTVRAGLSDEDKILQGITLRRRYTNGTVFLPGNDWLAIARDPADLVRDAAGFKFISADKLLASGCGFKDVPTERTVEIATSQQPRKKVLAVYLDGLRVVGGLPELRTSVSMRDVLAVEAYQDVRTAPAEWRTYDACAVLAIWTKR